MLAVVLVEENSVFSLSGGAKLPSLRGDSATFDGDAIKCEPIDVDAIEQTKDARDDSGIDTDLGQLNKSQRLDRLIAKQKQFYRTVSNGTNVRE